MWHLTSVWPCGIEKRDTVIFVILLEDVADTLTGNSSIFTQKYYNLKRIWHRGTFTVSSSFYQLTSAASMIPETWQQQVSAPLWKLGRHLLWVRGSAGWFQDRIRWNRTEPAALVCLLPMCAEYSASPQPCLVLIALLQENAPLFHQNRAEGSTKTHFVSSSKVP